MQRPLRVSLVIPARNEESHLTACLNAVATQTSAPFEVIVVDNNSNDNTAAIASAYPFVRVVREQKPGLVFARNAGFNAAHGDIIGRIDADTLLPSDWIATVQRLFGQKSYDAVSGSVEYYDIPLRRVVARIDLAFRRSIAWRLDKEVFLFGANMAIRRSAWEAVREDLCAAQHLHEDFDLAVHLAEAQRYEVCFDESLHARVSARCIEYAPRSFYSYMMANPRTYAAHGLRSQRCMYPLMAFLFVMYGPLRIMYRLTNPATGRFSLKYARTTSRPAHASPLTEPPLF